MVGSITVLVVEDDPPIAALLRDILAAEDYRVLPAATLAEALAILRAFRVQLVFTDALRPESQTSPWATLAPLVEAARGAPLILCTAHDPDDYADHTAHGFSAVLPKPFDIAELLALVVSLLPGGRGVGED
jgi:DNA-binding response OmpR family regulator